MVLHHNKLISCTYHWLSPGIDQRDTPGETPGTCGHFEKNLPCRVGTFVGFWNKRAGPQDSPTGCVWLWSALRLFQSPEWTWRWVTLLQFVWHFVELFSVCYMFVLQFFIMPLYKAWDVVWEKPIDRAILSVSQPIIDPNPNNSYKTKKNFTGFYTELNPIAQVGDLITRCLGINPANSVFIPRSLVLWGLLF